MPDLNALVNQVALVIKAALAPVLADVSQLKEKVAGVDLLRDRLVVVETKASQPAPVVPEPVQVDLTPLLERLAAAEAQLKMLGDVRDRVVAVETKALQPVFAMPPEACMDDLRDRIATLEAKAAGPNVTDMNLVDVRERVTNLERRVADDTLTKELGALRERVAVVEVRPQTPGPKGDPGEPGKDGANGRDGLAGLSFEGVYQEGKSYDPGNLVTWAGSSWHCNEATTTKPGDGSKAWTLMVKRGRDGKDGRDAAGALPIVSVGGSR